MAPDGVISSIEAAGERTKVNWETLIRSKILFHFIKGRISLSPMERILMIPGELEHLKNLVRLVKWKKDARGNR